MRKFLFLIIFVSSFHIGINEKNQPIFHSANSDYEKVGNLPFLSQNTSFTYTIDLIFAGFDSNIDFTQILSSLPRWYAPLERYPSYFSGQNIFHENYTILYNIRTLDNQYISDFRNFINGISTTDLAPASLQPMYEFADYIPSSPVEEYLNNTIRTDGTPTLVFLDTYTFDPVGYSPYFYNASSFDLDAESVPRPYGSQYQIAGGGENNRLLWMDLSAGPTDYRGGVDEKNTPPIWSYGGNYSSLLSDLEGYIRSAIELRFLPSYIYTPVHALNEVRFEFLLFDLDSTSTFNYLSMLKPEKLADEYSRVNPHLNWTYSVSTFDWASFSGFNTSMNAAYNSFYQQYSGYDVLNYLDTIYTILFNSSTPQVTVVPIFLFAFPGEQLFDSFLGVANYDTNGNFAYLVAGLNYKYAESSLDLRHNIPYSYTLPNNNYLSQSFDAGDSYNLLNISITVTSGSVNVFLFDEYNEGKYPINSYTSLYSSGGISSSLNFQYDVNINGTYFLVIENIGGTSSDFSYNIDIYDVKTYGFTFVTLHESGHGLGLSHPHDGFDWDTGEFGNWLWDLSYSVMSYAHHYSNLSRMGIDTLQRGGIGYYADNFIQDYNSLVNRLQTQTEYLLPDPFFELNLLASDLTGMYVLFSNYSLMNNLDLAMDRIMTLLHSLDQLEIKLEKIEVKVEIAVEMFPDENRFFELHLSFMDTEITKLLTENLTLSYTLPYVNFTLEIYESNSIVFQMTYFSWENPIIHILIPHLTIISSNSNSTTDTSSSQNTQTSKSKSDMQSDGLFVNFPMRYIISLPIVLIFWRNIKSKKNIKSMV